MVFPMCYGQLLVRSDLLNHTWFYISSTLSWSLYFIYQHVASLIFHFVLALYYPIRAEMAADGTEYL